MSKLIKLLKDNIVVINNKTIGKIDIKDLLDQKILIPCEQRIRDDLKVNEIIEYQEKYYKKGNHCFNFIGLINIHYCKKDNKNYLVDGQHRFRAMEILYNKFNYKSFYVTIEVIEVKDIEELKENYALINKNTELPEFPEETNKNVVDNVCNYFFNENKIIWTLKKRQIRPYLNKNNFQEAIAYLSVKLKESFGYELDEEDLKKIVSEKNDQMSSWTVEGYTKQIRKIKKWPEFLEICKKNYFFLGMYNYINEEYCYDWVKDIIKQYTGEELKKQKTVRKKRIPKKKREEVWTYNNGKSLVADCFCCGIKQLNGMGSWECGHIKSEANGGGLNTDNLKPICSGCNKSMSSKNMNEYMKEFYPKRYSLVFNVNNNVKKDDTVNNITKPKNKKYFLGLF